MYKKQLVSELHKLADGYNKAFIFFAYIKFINKLLLKKTKPKSLFLS